MSNDDFDMFAEFEADLNTITDISEVPTGDSIAIELDAERHVIFASQTVAYGAASEVLSANELLAENERKAKALRDKQAELKFAKDELQREYGAKLAAIMDEMQPIDNQLFDLTRERRRIERDIQGAEQRLRDALAFLKQQEQFKDNIEIFDKRSAGAFWREHAKDYQIDGARAIANANGCAILADKMGLGKTLTSQAALDMMGAKRVLIIVPDDIVSNFLSEVAHWAPHRTAFLLGKMTKAQRDITIGIMHNLEQFTGIINYSAWRRDKSLLTKLANLKFDTVILDEAHNVKNTSTASFKGVKQIIFADNTCPNCGGNIQHVHDSGDLIYNRNGYALPRDFFLCIGKHKQSSTTSEFDTVPVDSSCGWSQRSDLTENIKREYGALRSVKHVIPMTGTPILNKPQDLFALLHLIDPEHFETERRFLDSYCTQDFYTDKWAFRSGGLESLTKQLAGKYIARNRDTAGVVLPPQEIKYHNIEMDREAYPGQWKVMEQLSKHAMIVLNSGDKLPIVAMIALITRKRQANVWPAGIEIRDPKTEAIVFSVGDEVQESIKLDRMIMRPDRAESGDWEGMIPDMTGMGDKVNGERVVVFSQFKGPLRELENRLNEAGISVVRFDGDTPQDIRNQVKRDFDRKHLSDGEEYKWQVVLCNYRTGGVGLNFTAATQMIIVDEEWNVGKNEQAYARIDRIGQTEESTVHVLRLNGTVDTWMANLIDNKRNMVEGFETNAEMANDMLRKMQNGDII